MAAHEYRHGHKAVKELTDILEKINALLGDDNAEIDYNKVVYDQNIIPSVTITIRLRP
jgi:hypothetical protein